MDIHNKQIETIIKTNCENCDHNSVCFFQDQVIKTMAHMATIRGDMPILQQLECGCYKHTFVLKTLGLIGKGGLGGEKDMELYLKRRAVEVQEEHEKEKEAISREFDHKPVVTPKKPKCKHGLRCVNRNVPGCAKCEDYSNFKLKRECKNCKHHDDIIEDDCDNCIDHDNYEPKVKSCNECKYNYLQSDKRPCDVCNNYSLFMLCR